MDNKLIIALDNLSEKEVKKLVQEISKESSQYMDRITFKVNDVLFDVGLKGVKKLFERAESKNIFERFIVEINFIGEYFGIHGLKEFFYGKGAGIFLDKKIHDIGNTNANYIKKIAENGLGKKGEIITIHASNGKEAIRKAVETRNELGLKTKIFAVTALTSLGDNATNSIYENDAKHTVLKLAKQALEVGIDGIVCSPLEARLLRDIFGEKYDFEIITPGVRFENSEVKGDDQKRVMTPRRAIENGANHIVMGRPIIKNKHINGAIREVFEDIKHIFETKNEGGNEFEKFLYTGNWEELLKYVGAIYSGREKGEIFKLASGLLSYEYINFGKGERSAFVLQRASEELGEKLREKSITPDIVLGAQMGSVRISSFLGKNFGVDSIYTEKSEVEGMALKRHKMNLRNEDGGPKKIILSEDVITMGSTIDKMIELVKDAGGEVIAITCVINRYGKDNFKGIPLVSCFTPKQYKLYWDKKTPKDLREGRERIPKGTNVVKKAKNK